MATQYEKYKDNPNLYLVTARFQGKNQGYSYLFTSQLLEPAIGDFGVILDNNNEYTLVNIMDVKPASHMQNNPSFGKYRWILSIVTSDRLAQQEATIGCLEASSDAPSQPDTITQSQPVENNPLDRLF